MLYLPIAYVKVTYVSACVGISADVIDDLTARMAKLNFHVKCGARIMQYGICGWSGVWGSLSNSWFSEHSARSSQKAMYG